MINLIEYFTEQVEKANSIAISDKKIAAVFPGGFTPFHKGHLEQYKKIQKSFPGLPVFILFKNTTTGKRAILTADDKKRIVESYGVKPEFVKESKGALWGFKSIQEAIGDYDIMILAYGEKETEGSRRDGIKVTSFDDFKNKFVGINTYVYVIPKTTKYDISGTELRDAVKNNNAKIFKKYLTQTAIELLRNKVQ